MGSKAKERTQWIEHPTSRAPAGRMRFAPPFMRTAGTFWLSDRWLRLSRWPSLPTGYLHWPRRGRNSPAGLFYSTENSGEPSRSLTRNAAAGQGTMPVHETP